MGIVFYWTTGSLAYARSLFLTLCFADGFVPLYSPPTSCFMPSYTQAARESGGVRYVARPLRPALIMSNTARTAVNALPAGKPPSVCGKSAVKLRSRSEKSLVPCGFPGGKTVQPIQITFSLKNRVLLRNKAIAAPTQTRGAVSLFRLSALRSFSFIPLLFRPDIHKTKTTETKRICT